MSYRNLSTVCTSSLQLTLTILLLKPSQGSWADKKVTFIFIQNQNQANESLPLGASRVYLEAVNLVFIRSPHKVRVTGLGSQCPLPDTIIPEKVIFFPFSKHMFLESGLRVPGPEVICFCWIWWLIVAYSSQCLSHFLRLNLPIEWHSHTVNI